MTGYDRKSADNMRLVDNNQLTTADQLTKLFIGRGDIYQLFSMEN